MDRYRYTGSLESVDVPIPGAVIQFPCMTWVDPAEQCEAALVPVEHLKIVLAGLGDEFEREGPKKAAKTRKANAAAAAEEATDDPAAPDEEQDR